MVHHDDQFEFTEHGDFVELKAFYLSFVQTPTLFLLDQSGGIDKTKAVITDEFLHFLKTNDNFCREFMTTSGSKGWMKMKITKSEFMAFKLGFL